MDLAAREERAHVAQDRGLVRGEHPGQRVEHFVLGCRDVAEEQHARNGVRLTVARGMPQQLHDRLPGDALAVESAATARESQLRRVGSRRKVSRQGALLEGLRDIEGDFRIADAAAMALDESAQIGRGEELFAQRGPERRLYRGRDGAALLDAIRDHRLARGEDVRQQRRRGDARKPKAPSARVPE